MSEVVRALPRKTRNYCTGIEDYEPEELLESFNIVSCLDTGLASPFMYSIYRREHQKNLLTLHFDDVGNPEWTHEENNWQYQPFMPHHFERLKAWFEQTDKSLPFLSHCWAGISRSGTVGLWLNRALGNTDQAYFDANPQVMVNHHILAVMYPPELLGIEGQ